MSARATDTWWRAGQKFGYVTESDAAGVKPGDLIGVWTTQCRLRNLRDHESGKAMLLPFGEGYRVEFYNWGKRTPCLMRALYRDGGSLVCVPFGGNRRWADATVCRVPLLGAALCPIACIGYDDGAMLADAEADMGRFREAFVRRVINGWGGIDGRDNIARAILAVGGLPPGAERWAEGGLDDEVVLAVRGAELEEQWSQPPADKERSRGRG